MFLLVMVQMEVFQMSLALSHLVRASPDLPGKPKPDPTLQAGPLHSE